MTLYSNLNNWNKKNLSLKNDLFIFINLKNTEGTLAKIELELKLWL